MNILLDIIYTNKKMLKKTLTSIIKHQEIFILGIPYMLFGAIVFQIASGISFFASLIIYAGMSAIFSDYIFVVENIILYDRFNWNIVKHGYKVYFRKVFVLFFMFSLFTFGYSLFLAPIFSLLPFGGIMFYIILFGIAIVFNPLPEVYYNKNYPEIESLKYCFKFIKKNPIMWFLPNILLSVFTFYLLKLLFSLTAFFFQFGRLIGLSSQVFITILFIQVVVGIGAVYRGHLFRKLDTTSRKKRIFKRHM